MFRHMEYIYCVYQEKSFSRAAERLYISQSSLSLTIKKAEERIGTPIFDRKTTPLSLTEFGVEYISAVEKVMRLRDGLDNFLYETEHLSRGHISLGAANFCISYLLPPLLTTFRQTYPKIQVELHERSTPSLIRMLSEGRIDMMISNMALDDRFYQGTPFCQEHMVLVIPKGKAPACHLNSFRRGRRKHGPTFHWRKSRCLLFCYGLETTPGTGRTGFWPRETSTPRWCWSWTSSPRPTSLPVPAWALRWSATSSFSAPAPEIRCCIIRSPERLRSARSRSIFAETIL